jgi:hypothetical protein
MLCNRNQPISFSITPVDNITPADKTRKATKKRLKTTRNDSIRDFNNSKNDKNSVAGSVSNHLSMLPSIIDTKKSHVPV